MAIKTNYKLKEVVEVKDSIIKVDRLWGSSKEGWSALVRVYTKVSKEVPAVEADLDNGIEAVKAYTIDVLEQIEEFNHTCQFKVDERGYTSMYKSLTEKFGGVQC